jgi:hypothetical protein
MGADRESRALERVAELPLYHWRRTPPAQISEEPRFHWRRGRQPEPPRTLVRVDGSATLLGVRAVQLRFGRARQLGTGAFAVASGGVAWWLMTSRPETFWICTAPQLMISWAPLLWHAGKRAASRLRTSIERWQARPASSAQEADAGEWIRVTGHVLVGTGFRSAAGAEHCVLTHYLGDLGQPVDRDARTQVETHAVTFQIVSPANVIFHVAIEHGQFVARPIPLDVRLRDRDPLVSRPVTNHNGRQVEAIVRHEQTVRPGDEVEVVGQLHQEIDPTAAGGYRAPVLRRVLRGTPGRKLQIRAV